MSTLKTNIQVEPQELFTSSSTQGTDLGAYATTGDGRYFRYVLVGGTALVSGKLYQGAAESAANHEAITVTAPTAGATSITSTDTVTLAANALAGGWLTFNSGSTNLGYTLKIKGNTAASSAVVTFTLEDAVVATPTGTVKVDVIASPYSAVELWDSTNHDNTPVGVAIYNVSASQYGWLQVGGPCSLLSDSGGLGVGANVYASAATDGAGDATATYGFIGTAMEGISSGEYGFVFLNIN